MNPIIKRFAELTDQYNNGLITGVEFARTIECSCKSYIEREVSIAKSVLRAAKAK